MEHRTPKPAWRTRGTVIAFAAALLVAFALIVPASADSQYMEVPGCVDSGSSTVYGDTSALGLTDGCSGAYTYIATTVYKSGGTQYQCPFNLTWGYGDTYCIWNSGVASIYSTHRMQYSGSYSSYVSTSDS